jgi:hypothetical protein
MLGMVDLLYIQGEQQQQSHRRTVDSPLCGSGRARYVATNAAARTATGSLAGALIELRSLLQLVCYLTDSDFMARDKKGIV